MIRDFGCDRALLLFEGGWSKSEAAIEARTLLHVLDSQGVDACLSGFPRLLHHAHGFYSFRVDAGTRIRFRWSGGGASDVRMEDVDADEDRLDNVHPGDILREDFLIGSEIPLAEVAAGTGIDPVRLAALVASELDVDAGMDARLTRYFRMSDGFFLRLQNAYDLEEVERSEGADLDLIVPRAA